MRRWGRIALQLGIAAAIVLLVTGAEARRSGGAPPASGGPAPFGTYECWPAESPGDDPRA